LWLPSAGIIFIVLTPLPLSTLNASKAQQVELHFHNSFSCLLYSSTCLPFPILNGNFTFACAVLLRDNKGKNFRAGLLGMTLPSQNFCSRRDARNMK